MGGLTRNWCGRVLIGFLIMATGCASTPSSPTAEPPVPPTSAQAGDTTIIAIAPPAKECCPTPTLIDFLGITQIGRGLVGLTGRIGGRLRARLGTRFPGLEAKPALVAITDPANLSEDASPAQKAAANAKAEEDAAAQKGEALRYLATLGCGGCYPDVEAALLEGMKDCTEVVRFEAVSAVRDTTYCPCVYCNEGGCCSAKVQQALRQRAYETKDDGCYLEPSARVRRLARIALVQCSCVPLPVDEESELGEPPLPAEGPTAPPPPADITQQSDSIAKVQLASFEGKASAVADMEPDRLLATVNGQPIFLHHIAHQVSARYQAATASQRTTELRQRLIAQETERAIDDLLLYQLRSADLALRVNAFQAGATALPDMASFPAVRNENRQWLQGQLDVNQAIEPAAIAAHYDLQRDDHEQSAAARWEAITVHYGKGVSRDQAYRMTTYLRNKMRGIMADPPSNFRADLIRAKTHAWQNQAEIASPLIAQAVFSLPLAQVSPVMDDANAWHLVRVLERRAGGRQPLAAVQESIRSELLEQRVRAAEQAYFSEARRYAVIWQP